jgi:methylated-DNA-[protein]-cysteine S-methyltransferase
MRDPVTRSRAGDVETPLGRVVVVTAGDALVGLWFDGSAGTPPLSGPTEGTDELFALVGRQLDEYFSGARTRFDVPIRLNGTPFQCEVWSALLTIPHARTSTYGAIARRIGRPAAARAVGAANGHNPISIVVPCHRLVGSDGGLTGYGGGLDRKAWLLDHERRVAATSDAAISA